MNYSEIPAIILWITAVQLITAVIPFHLLGALPALAFFRRTIGLSVFALLIWLLSFLANMPFAPKSIWSVLAALALLKGANMRLRPSAAVTRLKHESNLVFFLAMLALLFVRSAMPEAGRLQRPMDMGLLQYFGRLEALPPHDPWAAGFNLSYYYFGFFLWSLPHKLFNIPSSMGYNLASATIGALACEVSYGLVLAITRSRQAAVVGMSLLCIVPTFTFFTLSFKPLPLAAALWESRQGRFLTEYPAWSLLLNQLHAHLMALPQTICFIACLIWKDRSPWMGYPVLLGLLFASIGMTNLWDAVAYSLLFGTFMICEFRSRRAQGAVLARDGALMALGMSPLFLFLASIKGNLPREMSLSSELQLLPVATVISHLMFPLILAACAAVICLTLRAFREISSTDLVYLLFVTLPPVAWIAGSGSLAILPMYVTLLALAVLFLLFLNRSHQSIAVRRIALTALVLLSVLDSIVLIDRMNTVFKLLLPAFVWITIASAAGFHGVLRRLRSSTPGRLLSGTAMCGCLAFCAAGALYFHRAASDLAAAMPFKGERPTLDGNRFLERRLPDDYRLIVWLNKNVAGTPTILEAYGPEMSEMGRISAYTGLPAVLGWPGHARQKGLSDAEAESRKRYVDNVYSAASPHEAARLLRGRQVRYVVVGRFERARYGLKDPSIFDAQPDLFQLKVRSGTSSLYELLE